MSDYISLNKANWDERAPLHAASRDYATQAFVEATDHLSQVVRFDLPLLGNIRGLRGVHLQCHIGTDTLSLARLGAQMSGLDFSPAALVQARSLALRCNTRIDYVEADVYNACSVLPAASFDLVYTGIGALCWLPSIDAWARTVSGLLKPGGRLFIREGHPVLWSLNESRADLLSIEQPYFERETPLVWDDDSTYVDTDVSLKATLTHEWNHGLGEIISALLNHGLAISGLVEHQSIPWDALPGQMSRDEQGEYHLKQAPWRLPLSYTLQAIKHGA
ncbi:SAM-dependent methyltransferase [Pseudomonas sp. S04]|jgi:SAM-dependent methyltransferase|uniref:class I SAM-dependent methyltransferase n=1 Tax=unclassified Pseudomonas TaxID=196821 RepID=UPI00131FD74B|nr:MULTISPECIES: class I SAM-dependent methyltransferase [unclassified Pseudomonas]QHD02465.1 SAM-dependent methyltransferase [Pseudomonas sp. S04]QHF34947.1 SAM-dependent methyltransferase [Pseudomonas sp. S19]